MHSTCGYIPETPIVTFPDWVGIPGSPCASDRALPTMEDASGSISSFEQEIDSLGLDFDGIDQPCFPYQSGMTFDWQSEFANALPVAFTLDVLSDDASSSAYTLNEPLSPTSEGTLVNSPTTATLPDLKLAAGEGALDEAQLASFPSLYSDAGFTFPCQPWFTTPALDMYTPMVQADYSHQDYDQYRPEQLPAQHELPAACVVVAGHTTGIDASTDSFALPYVDPASSLFSLSAEFQQDASAIGEEQKPVPVTRSKRRSSAPSDKPAGDKGNTSQTRKRPRQDTTKRFPCNQPGCESMFARKYNLNVHIRSVHFKERINACKAPGCERAFSRKHDLNRHFQSAHTNLGSPRKIAKEGGNAVKSRKSTKKVKRDE